MTTYQVIHEMLDDDGMTVRVEADASPAGLKHSDNSRLVLGRYGNAYLTPAQTAELGGVLLAQAAQFAGTSADAAAGIEEAIDRVRRTLRKVGNDLIANPSHGKVPHLLDLVANALSEAAFRMELTVDRLERGDDDR